LVGWEIDGFYPQIEEKIISQLLFLSGEKHKKKYKSLVSVGNNFGLRVSCLV